MGQKENMKQLLKLHGIITGTPMTVKQIISKRFVDPEISFIHSRKVASGDSVSVKDYYPLENECEINLTWGKVF